MICYQIHQKIHLNYQLDKILPIHQKEEILYLINKIVCIDLIFEKENPPVSQGDFVNLDVVSLNLEFCVGILLECKNLLDLNLKNHSNLQTSLQILFLDLVLIDYDVDINQNSFLLFFHWLLELNQQLDIQQFHNHNETLEEGFGYY
eukprot:TRINITY_DN84279_c0_g1_i1.p2 TRINITY_DN84279_c0_g1~~TRINITY_DN84279_c0_g1_i1.p2  ORF type:complete len:147 (-),score=6.50 TRINITY_DN84279_c0_g1_i1:151-591(-)